jgi:molybdopterin-synthase adenylyltransferase
MELHKRQELVEGLKAMADAPGPPGGAGVPAVPLAAMRSLAQEKSVALGDLERLALEEGLVPRRYLRNLGTIGMEGQLRLLEARAAVFGLGGLGGTVVELLARMGIGGLVLVDCDRFSDDNLNRQVLSTPANLGAWKAEVAAERVAAVNPAVTAAAHCLRAGRAEMEELLEGCSAAVDALDNIPSRFELQAACAARGVPLVHGAIAGFSGQVMTVYPGDAGVGLLYHEGEEHGVEVATGNPAATPAIVAALQVEEVVKIIAGVGEPLRRRLLFIDTESNLYEITEMS